jgi:isochorismate synthase
VSATRRAVATRLGPAFDLLATYRGTGDFFFERAGIGVSGHGVASTVGGRLSELADAAAAALATISVDTPGVVPLAAGALPFDPRAIGSLVIPRTATARNAAGAWRLDVAMDPGDNVTGDGDGDGDGDGEGEAGGVVRAGGGAPHAPFAGLQLTERPPASEYAGLVEAARARIRAGALDKVVLARMLEVDSGRVLDAKQLLWRLRATEPDGYAFAAPIGRGALVGASPELLAAVSGRSVRVNPLAGSAPRYGDPAADRVSAHGLLGSAKDRHEHEVVVRAVAAALAPICEDLRYPPEPILHATANVWHLATPFTGTLRADVKSVLTVAAALHPTPAVGGAPTEVALSLIRDLEPFDRGSYAGPVGWVDAEGDGVFALALRCAELNGERARLFAGAGIVDASEPAAEVDETDRKFRAFLDSLRWG